MIACATWRALILSLRFRVQVYYFSAGLVRPYHGGFVDNGMGDSSYSFNINSAKGVAFSLLLNNTDPESALLQRTTLAELKIHSKVGRLSDTLQRALTAICTSQIGSAGSLLSHRQLAVASFNHQLNTHPRASAKPHRGAMLWCMRRLCVF